MRGTISNRPHDTTPRAARAWRFSHALLHLLRGVFIAALIFPFSTPARRKRLAVNWSRQFLRIFAVRVKRHGTPPRATGALLVANHVSWLDIWLLLGAHPVRFVSKADVRGWPVIGWLAHKAGTLFIERTRRHHTGAINREVLAALRDGELIAIFPEGTTTNGQMLRPFHTSLFQPAVDQGAPIVPVAIRYVLAQGGFDPAPAYCDDISLWDSARQVLARRIIQAEVTYLAPIATQGKTRRELAREAEAAISAALNLPAPHRKSGTPGDPPSAAPTACPPTDSPYPAHSNRV